MRRAAWIPRRHPRSAFSLAPGPRRPRAGCAAAQRRGAQSRSALRLQPLPAPRSSSGRRLPTARPGTCPPRTAGADFPEGRRGRPGDFLGSRWFACCPPSPIPDATDRSPADPARRRGPSSGVLCLLRGVSGSPAPGGLCRRVAGAAVGSGHRGGIAGHLRCHCGGSVTPTLGRCGRK